MTSCPPIQVRQEACEGVGPGAHTSPGISSRRQLGYPLGAATIHGRAAKPTHRLCQYLHHHNSWGTKRQTPPAWTQPGLPPGLWLRDCGSMTGVLEELDYTVSALPTACSEHFPPRSQQPAARPAAQVHRHRDARQARARPLLKTLRSAWRWLTTTPSWCAAVPRSHHRAHGADDSG